MDAQRAIRTVRIWAGEYGIDPDRVGILGFSAGGHLATAGTHCDAGNPEAGCGRSAVVPSGCADPVLSGHFAAALSRHKVPFALHVYPHGGHGLGVAYDHPSASGWTRACADWLRWIGFAPSN